MSIRRLRMAALGLVLAGMATFAFGQGSADVTVHVEQCAAAFDAAQRSADGSTARGRSAIAAALLRTAYEALEPAYPPVRSGDAYADPNAAWLRARNVVPSSWSEDELNADAWRRALARMQEPYGLDPLPIGSMNDADALRSDVEAAVAAGAAQLRPLALFGIEADADGGESVSFGTVIWNWTPRPRLLAFDVDGERVPASGIAELLSSTGTCVWTPRSWIRAPADLARGFYLGNVETEVRILARPIDSFRGEIEVARGDEESVFRLAHPELEGQPYAALGFAGPGPSLGTVLRLAVSVRTNVGLFDLSRYLTFP